MSEDARHTIQRPHPFHLLLSLRKQISVATTRPTLIFPARASPPEEAAAEEAAEAAAPEEEAKRHESHKLPLLWGRKQTPTLSLSL